MEDHGQLITHFESIFGDIIDHEVIKIILQFCDWNSDEAHEKLLNLTDGSSLSTATLESLNAHPESSNECSGESKNKPESSRLYFEHCKLYGQDEASSLRANSPTVTASPSNLEIGQDSNYELKDAPLSKVDNIKFLISNNIKVLIIMRGLPGSGKSTLANLLVNKGVVLSTDDYFYDKYGNYKYNPNILSEAHNWNKDRAKLRISRGVTPIIIDNTNLEEWEFNSYVKYGISQGYYVDILEPGTEWQYNTKELAKKCIHNVPKKKIKEMRDRFNPSISIDQVLNKMNIKNNYPFENADSMKSRSTESLDYSDDPDIIVESSASSVTAEDPIGNNEITNEVKIDTAVSPQDFSDLVDNFGKLLKEDLAKKKGKSRENVIKNMTENLIEDEAMYKFCTDYEDKLGKPLHFKPYVGHELESPLINSNKKDVDPGSEDYLKEWDCIENTKLDSGHKDWDSTGIAGKENIDPSVSKESRPQRPRKRVNNNLYCVNEFGLPDQLEPEDSDISSWVPLDKQKVSWDDEDSTFSDNRSGDIAKKPLPNDITANNDESSSQKFFMLNKTTQYITSDYASCDSSSKVLTGNPEAFIPGPMHEEKLSEALTKSKLMLHKSSMTEESSFCNSSERPCSISKLTKFFPNIPQADLEDVLEKCDNDIDWTMNILIDGGYKISSLDDSDTSSIESSSNSETKNVIKNISEHQNYEEDDVLDIVDISYYVSPPQAKLPSPSKQAKPTSPRLAKPPSPPPQVKHPSTPSRAKLSNPPRAYEKKKADKSPIKSSSNISLNSEQQSEFCKGAQYLTMKMDPMEPSTPSRAKLFNPPRAHEKKKADKSPIKSSSSISLNSEQQSEFCKEGAQYLTMKMDPMFASQLINMYGPISSLNLMSGFTVEDRKVVLPLEICQMIYKYWSDTLEGKFEDELSIVNKFIEEDEELARKLQEEENIGAGSEDVFKTDPPTSFREICDLEKALKLSNSEIKSTSESKTCADILNLQKLQEEYKNVDPAAVEEEFLAQSSDYTATKFLLDYKYGKEVVEPKTVLAPGASIMIEQEACSSENEDAVEYEIVVDNPQVYRDEATMHYLERKKALQKAQEASQKGMKSVASYYAQMGNLHLGKFQEANERASEKILSAVNANQDPNTLDLHLLHVDEAIKAAQRFLSERKSVMINRKLKSLVLSIITGRGNHSIGGEARLKPAIKYFLSSGGYSFEEFSGMFHVTIRLEANPISQVLA